LHVLPSKDSPPDGQSTYLTSRVFRRGVRTLAQKQEVSTSVGDLAVVDQSDITDGNSEGDLQVEETIMVDS
jgi:hypothetical protein